FDLFSAIKVVHGLRGFVFDLQTKAPVSGAVIHVHGINHNVTTYRDGDFFRLLSPGKYDITVERLGYESETRANIFVTDQSSTYIEFKLKRVIINEDDKISSTGFYNKLRAITQHSTFRFISMMIISIVALSTVILGMITLYLRFRPQRYQLLAQDEDNALLSQRAKRHKTVKNTHAMPSDSEDGDEDEILCTSNSNTPMIA
ncbi:unnamed protein product, partial [Rotaria socialis]